MTAIVEFSIPADAFELGRTFSHPDVEVKLFQLVPRGHRFVPYLWVQGREGAIDELEAQLADDYRVDEFATVERSEGDRLYNVEWATELNGLFAGFRTHDLSIDYAKNIADQWEFRVFNREHGNLESFQEYCRDHDIPIDVERVYHPTPPGEPPDWGLTREQRDALLAAYRAGYFHVPQDVSLDAVGDELDISRQAASDRLHRGIQNLLSQTLLADVDTD